MIKKLLTAVISALCVMTCFVGAGISVYADENLSTDIIIYVSDDDAMPADGAHTFILMDGSNETRMQNTGNTASFTVTLPAGQDVKTVILYEEQSNPAGYVYDESVYGISLVANYDHTMLDSVDITKNGEDYAGNIFFANKINTAPPTPEAVIDPTTGEPMDPNAQNADPSSSPESSAEDTKYEREHVVYGKAVAMDAQSTTIRDGNDVEHIVYDSNVRIINKYNLNDEVVLAYNGSESDMKDAIIGKDLNISIIETTETEPEASAEPTDETVKPAASAKPEEESSDLKDPVINEKKSKGNTWIFIVLGAGALAIATIIGIIIGSKPVKPEDDDTEDLEEDDSEEEIDEDESEDETPDEEPSDTGASEEDNPLKEIKFSELERAEDDVQPEHTVEFIKADDSGPKDSEEK